MLLGLYRAATSLGGPLLGLELRRRLRRGKEDPARLPERFGVPGLPRPEGTLVWVHAASVGESLSVLPLIDALLERWRGLEILLTSGTVSSARILAARLPQRVLHQFVPLDRAAAWRRFLGHWRPSLALLVESELWPNLILEARGRGVPLALVNARLSARSFRRWRRAPASARKLLASFDLCLAQSEGDGERLAALGAREVRAVGNLKRAAPPLPADPQALAALAAAVGERPVWLAASVHPGEDEAVLAAHRRIAADVPGLLTIVAPRHPERGDALATRIEAQRLLLARRSRGELPSAVTAVYLADTLGELGLLYRQARLAFIGGSLIPHGGQNPLEAARLGCPPLLGPHMDNFREIADALLAADAALAVPDGEALARTVGDLLEDEAARDALAARAQTAAASEARVLDATIDALHPLLARAIGDAPA
jgi:3-deoxy-D-manno-octulosonic-acid transferase